MHARKSRKLGGEGAERAAAEGGGLSPARSEQDGWKGFFGPGSSAAREN